MTATATTQANQPDPNHTNTDQRADIARFHRDGFLGPYTLRTPTEMASIREHIERDVLPVRGPNAKNALQSRHLDDRAIHDLISDPEVLRRLRPLVGDDILVWATYFFNKEPGGTEIPWHQDANYWPIEPPINISIWMAVDEVTAENSCVQIIPGSHRTVLPHVPAREGMAFRQEADPDRINAETAIDMELAPGQYFIFNERLLHHSHANRSSRRRLGLSARYTVPFVEILDQDAPPLFPGHHCVVVSGEDRLGLNRVTTPPQAGR